MRIRFSFLIILSLFLNACSQTKSKYKKHIKREDTFSHHLHIVGKDSLDIHITITRPKSEQESYVLAFKQQDKKSNYQKIDTTWTHPKLDTCLADLAHLLYDQPFEEAQSATYVFKYQRWVLEEEEEGTEIDTLAFGQAIKEAWKNKDTLLDLTQSNLYVKPKFSKDDPKLKRAKMELNKALLSSVELTYGNARFFLDRSRFATWLSLDEDLKVKVDYLSAQNFIQNIADQLEMPLSEILALSENEFITDSLKNKTFPRMHIFHEVEFLMTSIPQGKAVSKPIVFVAQGLPRGLQNGLKDFVEVSILDQKLWLFRNGRLVLETSVVTGNQKYNRATPKGEYHVLFKTKDKVLRGPGYASFVKYWMPFYKGYGLHDANWRRRFGANIYENGGSHGCVNIPPKMAPMVYDNVFVGMDVIIR